MGNWDSIFNFAALPHKECPLFKLYLVYAAEKPAEEQKFAEILRQEDETEQILQVANQMIRTK